MGVQSKSNFKSLKEESQALNFGSSVNFLGGKGRERKSRILPKKERKRTLTPEREGEHAEPEIQKKRVLFTALNRGNYLNQSGKKGSRLSRNKGNPRLFYGRKGEKRIRWG